jgi:hypothetical protein
MAGDRTKKKSGAGITPGRKWRFSAYHDGREGRDVARCRVNVENVGTFDELVVDGWIHVEQMSRARWWVRLGDRTFWVRVGKDGNAAKVIDDASEGK